MFDLVCSKLRIRGMRSGSGSSSKTVGIIGANEASSMVAVVVTGPLIIVVHVASHTTNIEQLPFAAD